MRKDQKRNSRTGGFLLVLVSLATALPASSASYYTQRLEDSRAVYVTGPTGGDDTRALQQAINQLHEAQGLGVVFVGPGRYRINDTLYVWPGVRVLGWGAKRPVIVLPANTPGFQDSSHERVMFFFAGGRPGFGRGAGRPRGSVAAGAPVPDANPGTF